MNSRKIDPSMRRRLFGWILTLATVLQITARADDWLEAGPLMSSFPTLWESGWRQDGLGPLAWWQETSDTVSAGISPLISVVSTPSLDREQVDVLYPVLTWRRTGKEERWQVAQIISWVGASQQDGADEYFHRTVFPFYFQQKSVSGTNDYLAVFPFYGHLRNRLFRDETEFIAFPFYSKTRKRDVTTRNYVYPFFHLRDGPGLTGWQLWPLYGTQTRKETEGKDFLGDPLVTPASSSWFVLWPLIGHQHAELVQTNERVQQARFSVLASPFSPNRDRTTFDSTQVLPFYASMRSPDRDQTSYLWPFFTRTEDRKNQFVEWGAPWPFIGWANGEGKTSRRFWPFYGNIESGTSRRNFYLWPFYTHRHQEDTLFERERWTSGFILFDNNIIRNRETDEFRQETGFWPLFHYSHDMRGRERLRVLAVMENIVKNREAVERNYSPIWSAYYSERDPARGMASQSVLWNFFRRDVSTNEVRISTLFGLVQTKRTPEGDRHWRFLWLPKTNFVASGPERLSTNRTPVRPTRPGTVPGPDTMRLR